MSHSAASPTPTPARRPWHRLHLSTVILLIPVAAGILYPLTGWTLNPALAAGAMALSSVSVVTNSLRLRRFPIHTAHGPG